MSRFLSGDRPMRFYAKHRTAVFVTVIVALLACVALPGAGGVATPADYGYWLRQLFTARGMVRADPGVEIVAFDKTFDPRAYRPEELAAYPELRLLDNGAGIRYDRAVYAAVLDRLVAAGARQVMFDFVFEGPGPSAEGDRLFAEALKRHRDKAVIGFAYSAEVTPRPDGTAERTVAVHDPADAFLADDKPEEALGFVNVWPEENAYVARMTGREDKLCLARPDMAARMTTFGDMSLAARAAERCGAVVPADNRPRLIGFVGPAGSIVATPVHRLFDSGGAAFSARFRDRLVIVGPYSEIHYKGDWHPTPLGYMSGAEIQAN